MTKAEARRLLGVSSNYALAKALDINESAVSRWGRMVPIRRQGEIKLLAKAKSEDRAKVREFIRSLSLKVR